MLAKDNEDITEDEENSHEILIGKEMTREEVAEKVLEVLGM